MISSRRRGSTKDAVPMAVTSKHRESLTFATFLLPSFILPSRLRRPSHNVEASPIPSLSSSPMSINSDTYAKSTTSSQGYIADLTCAPSEPPISRLYPDTIRCTSCSSDVAFSSQIVSKGFHGRHGRAFLVSPPSALSASPPVPGLFPTPKILQSSMRDKGEGEELINIRVGESEKRQLVTGQHTVADIWCAICNAKLGWKYVDAKETSQQYKVGKFILETRRVTMHRMWEWDDRERNKSLDGRWDEGGAVTGCTDEVNDNRQVDQIIIFDSEDEDECDDIFSGTWDAIEVAERRRSRVNQRTGKKP